MKFKSEDQRCNTLLFKQRKFIESIPLNNVIGSLWLCLSFWTLYIPPCCSQRRYRSFGTSLSSLYRLLRSSKLSNWYFRLYSQFYTVYRRHFPSLGTDLRSSTCLIGYLSHRLSRTKVVIYFDFSRVHHPFGTVITTGDKPPPVMTFRLLVTEPTSLDQCSVSLLYIFSHSRRLTRSDVQFPSKTRTS